ncbi:MAG: hypothetical protein WCG25_06365 [bacterium]
MIANIISAHDMERKIDEIIIIGYFIFLNWITNIKNIKRIPIHKLFPKSAQTACCCSISAHTSYLTPDGKGLDFIISAILDVTSESAVFVVLSAVI